MTHTLSGKLPAKYKDFLIVASWKFKAKLEIVDDGDHLIYLIEGNKEAGKQMEKTIKRAELIESFSG